MRQVHMHTHVPTRTHAHTHTYGRANTSLQRLNLCDQHGLGFTEVLHSLLSQIPGQAQEVTGTDTDTDTDTYNQIKFSLISSFLNLIPDRCVWSLSDAGLRTTHIYLMRTRTHAHTHTHTHTHTHVVTRTSSRNTCNS